MMSKLKFFRELKNFTQEELSSKSGISVRTIQRIEAGSEPKGYTRRMLAETLEISESDLVTKIPLPVKLVSQAEIVNNSTEESTEKHGDSGLVNYSRIKIINLATLPFIILPPLNIFIPYLMRKILKVEHPIVKEMMSLQIMWTVFAPIIFFIGIFLKIGQQFTIFLILSLFLGNLFLILRNAFEIDRKQKLYFRLNFNLL